jgi:hypothetical protein
LGGLHWHIDHAVFTEILPFGSKHEVEGNHREICDLTNLPCNFLGTRAGHIVKNYSVQMCRNMSTKCWVVSVFVIPCAIEIKDISTVILECGPEHKNYKAETLRNTLFLKLKNASLHSWSYLMECWKHNDMTLSMLIADNIWYIYTHTHTHMHTQTHTHTHTQYGLILWRGYLLKYLVINGIVIKRVQFKQFKLR